MPTEKQYADFGRRVMDDYLEWWSDIDSSNLQDFAIEAGLLVEAKYDPSIHGEEMEGEPEPGDTIYVLNEEPPNA